MTRTRAMTMLPLLSMSNGTLLLSRGQLLRLAPAAAAPLAFHPPAYAGEPARPVTADETFYQADDKSFDFIAPPGWTVPEAGFRRDGTDPRRFHPEHLFRVTASDGGKSSIEVTVDLGYGNTLDSLGKPDAAAQRLENKLEFR